MGLKCRTKKPKLPVARFHLASNTSPVLVRQLWRNENMRHSSIVSQGRVVLNVLANLDALTN